MSDVMRSQHRDLTEAEKAQIAELKHMGENFCNLCDALGKSRELSSAKTRMEEAVMWAVKGVTA